MTRPSCVPSFNFHPRKPGPHWGSLPLHFFFEPVFLLRELNLSSSVSLTRTSQLVPPKEQTLGTVTTFTFTSNTSISELPAHLHSAPHSQNVKLQVWNNQTFTTTQSHSTINYHRSHSGLAGLLWNNIQMRCLSILANYGVINWTNLVVSWPQ